MMLWKAKAEDDLGLFRGMLNCLLIYLYLAGAVCWLFVACELLL